MGDQCTRHRTLAVIARSDGMLTQDANVRNGHQKHGSNKVAFSPTQYRLVRASASRQKLLAATHAKRRHSQDIQWTFEIEEGSVRPALPRDPEIAYAKPPSDSRYV